MMRIQNVSSQLLSDLERRIQSSANYNSAFLSH